MINPCFLKQKIYYKIYFIRSYTDRISCSIIGTRYYGLCRISRTRAINFYDYESCCGKNFGISTFAIETKDWDSYMNEYIWKRDV
jgi:hypothetical protein